ncbi:MAG: dynamin family protein [Alphaproteobacteria bacterium]|nr:dynamin family protein [Alphaproteobacteria bacterium]
MDRIPFLPGVSFGYLRHHLRKRNEHRHTRHAQIGDAHAKAAKGLQMDIRSYESAKFALAEILRSALPAAKAARPNEPYPFEDIFSRLAEDRFNLAVVGQFSRGKTSLMNAMLGTDRLPMGIVPLTSVITAVQYGPVERVTLEYNERRLPSEIPLDDLTQYVTQRHNPGNAKGIRLARLELPTELLRRGFHLIDTPGLGSAITANTQATQSFLPLADAVILVTSYDSPLSEGDLMLLEHLSARDFKIFVVVNKQDLASTSERAEALAHVRAALRTIDTDRQIDVFSVSAREGIEAQRSGNALQFSESGLPHFLEGLVCFLVDEKQTVFLQRICDRMRQQFDELGGCQLALQRLDFFQGQFAISSPEHDRPATWRLHPTQRTTFMSCAVCAQIERAVYNFLAEFQYQISIDQTLQSKLAEQGGLCSFHTWQYASLASPHGTCLGFPRTLERAAKRIREAGKEFRPEHPGPIPAHSPSRPNCLACRVRDDAEGHAAREAAGTVESYTNSPRQRIPHVCLPHLGIVASFIRNEEAANAFLTTQAELYERVVEDMRRYALKRDGVRKTLLTADELDAHLRGMRALCGHQRVSSPSLI